MVPIFIKNNTGTNFTSNTWVAVELKGDVEWILLKNVKSTQDYFMVYFLDQDETTQLSFFRLVFNYTRKYAVFLVQLPSLPTSGRTIFLATDSATDRAFLGAGTPSLATAFYDPIYAQAINLVTSSPFTVSTTSSTLTMSIPTSTDNDVFIAYFRRTSTGSTTIISAGNSGIGFNSNNQIGYRRATYSSLSSTSLDYFAACSAPGVVFLDETSATISGGTYSSGTTLTINHSGAAVFKAVYIRDFASFSSSYYLALRRLWRNLVTSHVGFGVAAFSQLVISWDQSGIQVLNPLTGRWEARALPAARYDGKRRISFRPVGQAVLKEAGEYDVVVPEELARFWATIRTG